MFEPLTKEYIENTIRQPIKAKEVFKEFLTHNLVFEDYLMAIKSRPVLRDGKQYNDIEDITRVYKLMDWVIIVDWLNNSICSHSKFNESSANRLRNWTKLNTAWGETIRNLDEVKAL